MAHFKAVIGRSQAEESLFLCGEMILTAFCIKLLPETKRRKQMHITAECTSETLVDNKCVWHYLSLYKIMICSVVLHGLVIYSKALLMVNL